MNAKLFYVRFIGCDEVEVEPELIDVLTKEVDGVKRFYYEHKYWTGSSCSIFLKEEGKIQYPENVDGSDYWDDDFYFWLYLENESNEKISEIIKNELKEKAEELEAHIKYEMGVLEDLKGLYSGVSGSLTIYPVKEK